MANKSYEDLNLNNAFLFGAALQDPETCQIVLEIILGHSIPKVTVSVEHTLMFSSDLRSVRLDVYASNETKVGYNLEMQNSHKRSLPKRSRFYQAEMDVFALKQGEDFELLQPSYVIFICTFDPFDKKRYQYTFENRCLEEDFPLGDGTRKIFLNTKGENENEVPKLLVDFLHYVENTTDGYVENLNDDRMNKLHHKIKTLKKSREWRARYMKMEELLRESKEMGLQQGHQQGLQQGLQQGSERMLKLVSKMVTAGEADLIPKLNEDQELLAHMYEKYNV